MLFFPEVFSYIIIVWVGGDDYQFAGMRLSWRLAWAISNLLNTEEVFDKQLEHALSWWETKIEQAMAGRPLGAVGFQVSWDELGGIQDYGYLALPDQR